MHRVGTVLNRTLVDVAKALNANRSVMLMMKYGNIQGRQHM